MSAFEIWVIQYSFENKNKILETDKQMIMIIRGGGGWRSEGAAWVGFECYS